MAIRFDAGEITNRPHVCEDGTLLCDAVFARDGVLEYRDAATGAVRRELRLPEENQKAIAKFGLSPVTDEHPTELVNDKNAASLRKGLSLQQPRYVMVPGKGGFVQGQVAIFDSEVKDAVLRGDRKELSAGYRCRLEESSGVWTDSAGKEHRYDAIQRDLDINHIAVTRWGRAGPDVALRVDSAEADDIAYQVVPEPTPPPTKESPAMPEQMQLATTLVDNTVQLSIPGGSIPVSRDVFDAIAPQLSRVDSLATESTELRTRVDALSTELKQAREDADYEAGKAEGLRDRLDAAESLLEELGYRRDGSGYKKDMSTMKEDPDLEMDWDDEEEEEVPATKKEKKAYKRDSADPLAVAKQLVSAWREADALVPGLSETHFDSVSDPAEIRRLVVAERKPDINLDSKTDAYVEALYDLLREDAADSDDCDRNDSGTSYASAFGQVLNSATRRTDGADESVQRRMNAHKAPLSTSKRTAK